jgi:predicted dehydrogenase
MTLAIRQDSKTPTTERLGLAIIGTGRAGMIHARNFARLEGASVVALADASAASAQAAEAECGGAYACQDYRAALARPDVAAVVIATPSSLHREIAVAAARAGKHILCEKPMAMDATECDAMTAAVEAAGVKLQLGFMRRFDAAFVQARARVAAGDIGAVVQVRSITYGPSVPQPWMYDLARSNGPLSEVNSHDIDTLRWFAGSEIEEVYAVAGNYRSPDARATFPDFYDNVLLLARFRNGAQGCIGGAQGVGYGYDARCEILGERGLVTVGGVPADAVLTPPTDGAPSIARSWRELFAEAYLAEDEAFLRCIREDTPPVVGGLDGAMAVRVVNAGNRSIRERRPVRLEEVS